MELGNYARGRGKINIPGADMQSMNAKILIRLRQVLGHGTS
jgi:hypothetical protein